MLAYKDDVDWLNNKKVKTAIDDYKQSGITLVLVTKENYSKLYGPSLVALAPFFNNEEPADISLTGDAKRGKRGQSEFENPPAKK